MRTWDELLTFARSQFELDIAAACPPRPFVVAGDVKRPSLAVFLRPFDREDVAWALGEAVLAAAAARPVRIAAALSVRLHAPNDPGGDPGGGGGSRRAPERPRQALMVVDLRRTEGRLSDGGTEVVPFTREGRRVRWSPVESLGVPEHDRFKLREVLELAIDAVRRPASVAERRRWLAAAIALGHLVALAPDAKIEGIDERDLEPPAPGSYPCPN